MIVYTRQAPTTTTIYNIITGNNNILYSILENDKTTTAGSLEKNKNNNNTVPIVFGDLSVNRLSSSMCIILCVWLKRTMRRERHVVRISIHQRDIYVLWRWTEISHCNFIHIITIRVYIIGALSSEGIPSVVERMCRWNERLYVYTTSRWKRVWLALESRASQAVSIIYNNNMSKTVFQYDSNRTEVHAIHRQTSLQLCIIVPTINSVLRITRLMIIHIIILIASENRIKNGVHWKLNKKYIYYNIRKPQRF